MRTTGPNPMVWHAFLVRLRGTRTAKIGLSAGQRSGSRAPPCLQWWTSPQSNLTRVVRRLARLRITSCRRIAARSALQQIWYFGAVRPFARIKRGQKEAGREKEDVTWTLLCGSMC